MKDIKGKIAREIRTDFITGFLVVLPIVITLWVVWLLVSKFIAVSLKILPAEAPLLAKALWAIFITTLSILGIIIIGIAARNVIGKKLIDLGERLIRRIPIVKWVYETVKKISETFLGQKLKVFQKVVLLEYPHEGIYYVGFVTSRIKNGIASKSDEPHVSVFIPTTPNPTSGFLIILPEKDVIPLSISIEDAMRFIISVGAILPDSKIIKK
jgi:uncharacterized membrane protein